jgi:hypothetical protein
MGGLSQNAGIHSVGFIPSKMHGFEQYFEMIATSRLVLDQQDHEEHHFQLFVAPIIQMPKGDTPLSY